MVSYICERNSRGKICTDCNLWLQLVERQKNAKAELLSFSNLAVAFFNLIL